MNIIEKLLDDEYIKTLFDKNILPNYQGAETIKKIEISTIKNHIWHTTYHVVFCYKTTLILKNGKEKKVLIYCTAHSSEPRKNAFEALEHLWHCGFSQGSLIAPRPLYYTEEFNATFYQGVSGDNLYQYIRQGDKEVINDLLIKTANWLRKLHGLKTSGVKNFSVDNSRLRTVYPGRDMVLEKVSEVYPELQSDFKKLYDYFIDNEEQFFAEYPKRWLIHGDAHPENVIRVSAKQIAFIDFTDMGMGDFARDLGSFMQQFEFMASKKIGDQPYVEEAKELFLTNYLKFAKIEMSDGLRRRIELYYHWTAIRTATFFLIKHSPEPERALPLIKNAIISLGL